MIDADTLIKQDKEAAMFHDIARIRCRWCMVKITPYRRDINWNPVYDELCATCFMKHVKALPGVECKAIPSITSCNRCMENERMPGFGWCGPCALKHQEYRLAEGEEPVVVEQSIAAIHIAMERQFAGNTTRQG